MIENTPIVSEILYFLRDPQFAIFWNICFFFVGACFGSFLNVCIYRMPRGETVVTTPSHCPKCNTPLAGYDNIPIFAYLWLRGKCRTCQCHISIQYLAMELLIGTLFLISWLQVLYFKVHVFHLPLFWGLSCLAVGAIFVDWKHRIIPNGMTYPLIVLGFVWAALFPSAFTDPYHLGFYELGEFRGLMMVAFYTFIPAVLLVMLRGIGYLWMRKEILGWGDIKMIVAMVACLGGVDVFWIICIASILSFGFIGYVCGVRIRRGRRITHCPTVPYGVFLGVALLFWILVIRGFGFYA